MDARRSVGAAVGLMDGDDALQQHRVLLRSCRRLSLEPRPEAAGGDAQHTAQGGDVVVRLLSRHEREPLDRVDPISVAKKALADVFDVSLGEARQHPLSSVAAWFLDHDYDGEVFHVCQSFFPSRRAGRRSAEL